MEPVSKGGRMWRRVLAVAVLTAGTFVCGAVEEDFAACGLNELGIQVPFPHPSAMGGLEFGLSRGGVEVEKAGVVRDAGGEVTILSLVDLAEADVSDLASLPPPPACTRLSPVSTCSRFEIMKCLIRGKWWKWWCQFCCPLSVWYRTIGDDRTELGTRRSRAS